MNDLTGPHRDLTGRPEQSSRSDLPCSPRSTGGRWGRSESTPRNTTKPTPTPGEVNDTDVDDWRRGDPADFIEASVDPLAMMLDLFRRSRPDWHDAAACRDSGVDFTASGKTERARAFDICGRCEVRLECLDWALEVGDDTAILGGLDPAARRRHRAQREER